MRPSDFVMLFLHQEAAQEERVHAGTEKGTDGVSGRMDNGFTAKVERSVHDHGNASTLAEFVD
jgi:hypothetical protein